MIEVSIANQLEDVGFVVLDDLCEGLDLSGIADSVISARPYYEVDDYEYLDATGVSGGKSTFRHLSAHEVQKFAPELIDFYREKRFFLSSHLGKDVILSPYELSSVTAMILPPESGIIGWHYDTQPLTLLLYLTEGSATEIVNDWGDEFSVIPSPGRALLMYGRECRHRVLQNTGTAPRVTIPFNYYYPDDLWRPDYVDKRDFCNKVY